MNGLELYLLGRRLMRIGGDALPADSGVRRISPSARLVLTDAFEHLGASVDEVAERTGLPPDFVFTVLSRLADEGFVETTPDPADPRRILIRGGRDAAVLRQSVRLGLSPTETAKICTSALQNNLTDSRQCEILMQLMQAKAANSRSYIRAMPEKLPRIITIF